MGQKLFSFKDIKLEFQKFQQEIKLRKGELLDLSDISEQGLKTKNFSINIHVLFKDGTEAIIYSDSGEIILEKKVYRKINGILFIDEVPLEKGVLCCSKLKNEISLLKINDPAVIPVTISNRKDEVSYLNKGVPVKEVMILNPNLIKIFGPGSS